MKMQPHHVAGHFALLFLATAAGQDGGSLSAIENQYVAAFQLHVEEGHLAKVANLNGKYQAALEKAVQAASEGGRLKEALSLRGEVERVKAKQPVPESDEGIEPALIKLRSVYRGQLSRLMAARRDAAEPIVKRFEQELITLQTALTKAGKLDEAAAVMAYRESGVAAKLLGSRAEADRGAAVAGVLVAGARKDNAFVNSLGMKFVPVEGTDVLFCIHETRWKDYAEFVKAKPDIGGNWRTQTHRNFALKERPEDHPVVYVSWEDAKAFCGWLSEREKKTYRLPAEKEWAIAVGSDDFPWGGQWPPPKGSGNFSDESCKAQAPGGDQYLDGYNDGFPTTAPVMSYSPNKFGLYDIGGNVWEWIEDWWDEAKACRKLLGAAWNNYHGMASLRCKVWYQCHPSSRSEASGFRLVLDMGAVTTHPLGLDVPNAVEKPQTNVTGPAVTSATTEKPKINLVTKSSISQAAKDKPFENSLGMKLVPVKGTDVLFCIHETRWKDYAEFARATPGLNELWKNQSHDGFQISELAESHPVVYVSWEDSRAFCAWLSFRDKWTYRLPTDREWSAAVGQRLREKWSKGDTPESLGKRASSDYFWGEDWPPPMGAGNFSDESRKLKAPHLNARYIDGYDDGFPTTAPVMSFRPNSLGLYDMGGNVWEWVEDWWNEENKEHVIRGGAWDCCGTRTGTRTSLSGGRGKYFGFRVVLEVPKTP